MLSALRAFLAHFGEVAHKDASHLGHVIKADWDALVAKLSEDASDAKLVVEAHLSASTVIHEPAQGTVSVQLPAGGLHALTELAAEPAPPAAEHEPDPLV